MKSNIKQYTSNGFIFFALFVIALLVYKPCLKGPFIWDDLSLITHNISFNKPFSFFSQALYPTSQGISGSFYYRPFQALSYYLDYKIWGFNAFGFHLVNVLIHSLNAFMIYLLLARFLPGIRKNDSVISVGASAKVVPVLMGVLFLVHPIFLTSVAYIAGRADLLVCLFILMGLFFLDCLIQTRKRVFYAACLIAFFAALLSKESAVLAPFLFVACLVFRLDGSDRQHNKMFFPLMASFCIIMLLYFFLRAGILGVSTGLRIPMSFSMSTFAALLKMLCGYVGLFFFPFQSYLGRVLALEPSFFSGFVLLSCLFLAGIVFLFVRWLKKSYYGACFGLAWFFLWVFPLSVFCILFGRLGAYVIMPENNLYVAGFGLLCVAGFFLNHFFHIRKNVVLRKWVCAAIGIYVLCFAAITFEGSKKWSDDIVFYEYLLDMNRGKPSAALIYKNLALVYKRQGDYVKAIENYALSLKGGEDADVYHNLGNIYLEQGALDLAGKQYMKAIELNPRLGCSYVGLGLVFLRQANMEKAREMFITGLKVSPDDPRLKAMVMDILSETQAKE
ncbi:MAG: tetratricopeptide repeat protein [Candidatus Omnitrophota bacterium]